MNGLKDYVAKLSSLTDPFEKAKLLSQAKKNGISLSKIAKELKVNLSYLSHILRLLKLPDMLVDGYYAESISLSHLFIISRLKNYEEMIKVYEKVLKENLSVQQTEEEVRYILHKVKDVDERYFSKESIEEIKNSFKKFLPEGVKIKIIQTRVKVKIIIEGKGNLRATGKVLKAVVNLLKRAKDKNKKKARMKAGE